MRRMSKCIIARINIEAPEECDFERLTAGIWYRTYRFYEDTRQVLRANINDTPTSTRGISVDLVIDGELFAEARKIVDAFIEKIEEYILNNGSYGGVSVAGAEMMLGECSEF
jgi:hypothetical protein